MTMTTIMMKKQIMGQMAQDIKKEIGMNTISKVEMMAVVLMEVRKEQQTIDNFLWRKNRWYFKILYTLLRIIENLWRFFKFFKMMENSDLLFLSMKLF